MIVGFSTSSPWASVALISEEGELLWTAFEPANQRASGVCLDLLDRGLDETGNTLKQASLFVADLGPGSFTGVRVGIVLAKTLAYVCKVRCAGVDAFDLVSPTELVVMPSKKGEHFVRRPGETPFRTVDLPEEPVVGYGFKGGEQPPHAARFARFVGRFQIVEPERLVPVYLIEPSISTPKRPFQALEPRGE